MVSGDNVWGSLGQVLGGWCDVMSMCVVNPDYL